MNPRSIKGKFGQVRRVGVIRPELSRMEIELEQKKDLLVHSIRYFRSKKASEADLQELRKDLLEIVNDFIKVTRLERRLRGVTLRSTDAYRAIAQQDLRRSQRMDTIMNDLYLELALAVEAQVLPQSIWKEKNDAYRKETEWLTKQVKRTIRRVRNRILRKFPQERKAIGEHMRRLRRTLRGRRR